MAWPTQVIVLTGIDGFVDIDNYYGGNTHSLMMDEFKRAPGNPSDPQHVSAFLLSLEWETRRNHIGKWFDIMKAKRDEAFMSLVYREYPNKIKYWNYFVKLRYNTIWASFGYTEGQAQITLDLLDLLTDHPDYIYVTENYQQIREKELGIYHAQKASSKISEATKQRRAKPKGVRRKKSKIW